MLLLQIFAMKLVETSVLDKLKHIKHLLRNDVSREWLNSSFRFGPYCSFFSFCKLIKLNTLEPLGLASLWSVNEIYNTRKQIDRCVL